MSRFQALSQKEEAILRKELIYLYYSMFRHRPDKVIISHYLSVHNTLLARNFYLDKRLDTVKIVVEHRLSAVGVEKCLRKKGKKHPLSVKMLLITYLYEVLSYPDTKSPYLKRMKYTYLHMMSLACRSFVAIFIGYRQKKKYGLL